LDNDTRKQGRRLYGTPFRIESPTVLSNIESPTVILKTGHYDEEIKLDIYKNVNASVKFL